MNNIDMKHLKYIALFVGLALFVSCGETDVEGDVMDDASVAQFYGFIGNGATKGVTGEQYDANDAIGIFALTPDAEPVGVYNGYANRHYTTIAGDGIFVGKGQDDKIFFPTMGDLDFVAYYPYTSTMSGFDYAIEVGTDPLYSTIAAGYNKNNTTVGLQFHHMLSKMRLVMQVGKNVARFDELEVSIENVSTSGVFNVATKEVTRAAATTIKLDFDIADDKKTALIEQLVMPGQNLQNVRFVFKINGSNYTWLPSESMLLESNIEFTYKLELNDDLKIVQIGGATINEWGEGYIADDYEGIRPNAIYPK